MTRLITLFLLLFVLTFGAVAADRPQPIACKGFNTYARVRLHDSPITFQSMRYCRLYVTVKLADRRFFRVESTHDVVLIPLDSGCQWWQAHGGGIYEHQKQARMSARTCRFRMHVVLEDGAPRNQRWVIRIVTTEGIQ